MKRITYILSLIMLSIAGQGQDVIFDGKPTQIDTVKPTTVAEPLVFEVPATGYLNIETLMKGSNNMNVRISVIQVNADVDDPYVLSAATVSDNVVGVNMSEYINPDSLNVSDWVVYESGLSVSLDSIWASGSTIFIRCVSSLTEGTALAMDYTRGIVQDTSILYYKNKLQTFSDSAITNNVTGGAYFDMFEVDATGGGFTYSMSLYGVIGDSISVIWGNGNDTTVYFTGAMQTLTNYYATGTYKQSWEVNKLSVNRIIAANQNIYNNIPIGLQGFYNLTHLALNDNNLAGDLSINDWPTELSNWANIVEFKIYDNILSGDLSAWSTLSTWTSIVDFWIRDNQFTGISYIPSANILNYRANLLYVTSTAQVDKLFSDYDAFFTAVGGGNPPIKDMILYIDEGTTASPTGGASNANIVSLQAKFTGAGFTFSYKIN